MRLSTPHLQSFHVPVFRTVPTYIVAAAIAIVLVLALFASRPLTGLMTDAAPLAVTATSTPEITHLQRAMATSPILAKNRPEAAAAEITILDNLGMDHVPVFGK